MNSLKSILTEQLTESAKVKQTLLSDQALQTHIVQAGQKLVEAVNSGKTIYMCGNGGSAHDAGHFREELVARYLRERRAIPAVDFGDVGIITCYANDYPEGFEDSFKRQAEAMCKPGDILVAFTTSGNSENVLRAVKAAKLKGTYTIAMTGKNGGKIKALADLSIVVPSESTARIQEVHITLVHTFLEMIELNLEG